MQKRQTQVMKAYFAVYFCGALVIAVQQVIARQWMAGASLIALACATAPLLSFHDAAPLMRASYWNAAGLSCALVLESQGVDSQPRLVNVTGSLILIALYAMIFALPPRRRTFSLTTLFSPPKRDPARSAYEEQIRQAGAQEERNRLARDLHDSIKQQIFAIQTSAAAAQVRFDRDAPGARAALDGIRASAREAMVEMEAMLDQLRAVPLETVGLVEALKKQCEALQYRTGAQVQVDLATVPAPDRLPPGATQSLFRIAQEALANIARHARASEVKLALSTIGRDCVLRIEDNGSGFAGVQPGMGLANMRARATEQGGSLTVDSAPGAGTRIEARLPFLAPASPSADRTLVRVLWTLGGIVLALFWLVALRHPNQDMWPLLYLTGALAGLGINQYIKGNRA